jgi:hypothetical protein
MRSDVRALTERIEVVAIQKVHPLLRSPPPTPPPTAVPADLTWLEGESTDTMFERGGELGCVDPLPISRCWASSLLLKSNGRARA